MREKFVYILLIALTFVSCEEYYTPELDSAQSMLVVESHMTNDPTQNFVRLTMTQPFYSGVADKVTGAKVEFISVGAETTRGIESSQGYYTFSQIPVPGKKYLLRITHQKDLYESDVVIMPPLPSIDSLYTHHKVEKIYRASSYGPPFLEEIPGREICINAPVTQKLEYYRFNWQAVLQWLYPPPQTDPLFIPPIWYGWVSVYNNGPFNLAGSKEFRVSDKVLNHPILSLPYNCEAYLDSSALIPAGWILIIDQYGITKDSYNFHEKLNKQFSAEGSLFDPMLTQVYGNMVCRTNPEKKVLGFFDLNSYRQHRYYLYLGNGDERLVIQRRINRYPDIPPGGYKDDGTFPEFWENKYL